MGRHNKPSGPMPEISRRATSLGTENAFVVLAEVNALARQGKDIIWFCIGQPDFPAPEQRAGGRDPRHQAAASTATRPPRASTSCARRRRKYMAGMRGGLPIRAGGRRRRRRREALHRLRDRLDHRLRRRRRGDLSQSRASRSTSRRSSPTARCRCRSTCTRARDFAFDPAELERLITPQDAAADPQLPAQPDRRHASARNDLERSPRSCASIRRSGSTPTRSIRAWCYDGRVLLASRSCRACTSAPSSPTARRRPGR